MLRCVLFRLKKTTVCEVFMPAKKTRRFDETLKGVMHDARLNARGYDIAPGEVQWAILAQLIDLNFEVRELREELRVLRGNNEQS